MLKSFFAALLACTLGLAAGVAAAASAGEVLLITGSGTATNPSDGSIRSLAKGDAVHAGEIVSSAANSYINIKFSDGGYVLLRPNSRFAIERYVDGAVVKTAAAAPAAPATPARAPATTLATPAPAAQGDWGVGVEAYLDPADAEGVAGRLRARGLAAEVVAVQVRKDTVWHRVLIGGLANRESAEATVEDLKRRGYRAPFVVAGVTRPAATVATPSAPTPAAPPTPVAEPQADTAPAPTPAPLQRSIVAATQPELPPGRSVASFRLLKGGFRAVSGLIGRADPAEYRVNTPVATIGIRGTDYVVILCDAPCAQDTVFEGTLPFGSTAEGGVIVGVVQGGVFVVNQNGQQAEVGEGQYLVTLPDGTHIYLPFEPRFLKVDPIPDPVEMCD